MESIRKSLACLLFLLLVMAPAWGARKKRAAPPRALATLRNSDLEVAVAADGSYTITAHGAAAPVLHAQAAAVTDFRLLPAGAYPKHSVVENSFMDDLGSGHMVTITHTGLSGQPDLICSLRLYDRRPYGSIAVQVHNTAEKPITVQEIRGIQSVGEPIINLSGPASADRVMSDSYSEDRPAMKIMDLGEPTNGLHRAVGSQLIYNRQSGQSLFLGALSSERFLTIFHLKAQTTPQPQITSYDVESTGTTEILKGESLKDSPSDDQIDLSLRVGPGETLAGEPLMFAAGHDYYAQLENYGEAIRVLHHARVSAPTPIGWWSWTAYYFGLTQGTALTNTQWLAQNLKQLGYTYFHIDEGYQYARGEYATPNATNFPMGMGFIGDRVRHLGLTFGIWTAPFEVSERSWVFQNHKDWLVQNRAGQPIHLGHVTDSKDQLYALDTTNPGAQEYLRQTYTTLAKDWGVRYIKMDFMDDSCVEGHHYVPNTTALQAQRIGLQIIRDTVGDHVVLDKDGSPMLNPVGIVDTGRISVDTGHAFVASKEAAPGIAARYYMNRNFFVSDPDAFSVSRQTIAEHTWHGGQTPLTLDEAKVSIVLAAVSGGMYEIGDDLPTLGLDADRLALVQNQDMINMARLGRAALPLDLMNYRPEDQMPSIFLLQEDAHQSMLAVFNWTEQPTSHSFSMADLKLKAEEQAFDVLDQEKPVAISNGSLVLDNQAPHSVRLIKLVDTSLPAAGPTITEQVPPVAKLGEDLNFVAQADSKGVPAVAYHWDFGDGVKMDGANVHHTYTVPGERTVRLTVDGVDGVPAEKTFTVNVSGSALNSLFTPTENKRWTPPAEKNPPAAQPKS
ncbi:MAG TPA: alpha-galactosidase [Terriglobales bacterium]|nr:alpha-galactosidase [Terriglobales bacterium]